MSGTLLHDQLTYLKDRGYHGMTLSEAERRRSDGTLPQRTVVVTFDDGYASTLQAVPILAEVGFPGTVFVVTSFVESGERLSWRGIESWPEDELSPLSWSELDGLVEAGWEVGSHTVTHPLLTRTDDRRLEAELVDSRSAIHERLGACTSLAYPYGLADERVAEETRRAGYRVACMLTFAHFVDEPFRRPRVGMGRGDSGLRFALQVSHIGQSARRSPAARLARALHRRRSWLPDE